MTKKPEQRLFICVVVDMAGRFIAAFQEHEDAHKFILRAEGKYNMHDIIETDVLMRG